MHQYLTHISYSSDLWTTIKKSNNLEAGIVHIWKAELDADSNEIDAFWPTLSEVEKKRADRFYFQKDRTHFIKARGILRHLLSRYLSLDPKALIFDYNKFGKPYLKNSTLHFNVSHSNGLGLFAFTQNALIGVDLEKIKKQIDFETITSRFFSQNEANLILSLDLNDRTESFYKCWTRKEAFIKAHGEGLSIPLDQFEVSILDSEDVQLKIVRWNPKAIEDWSMISFEPDKEWLGALVVKSPIQQVNFYKWE